ncbi:MAG TPA: SDR family oxidoreductase [Marmoricola sp.]|jgi:3-oxoacyl-[acyl-carrier protein] reductase|nr:SDR family oxidoreductase [Nocardioidaceae bacterium]MCB8993591.1 SDR family oxidoreductase [Nocardioidaceae bacterium]MCO5323403.1 SDR family oxidoreductase [Nocardioidaceae bacterium]HRV68558.1 SDR family oxidoreductase [Marmoricola sp.]
MSFGHRPGVALVIGGSGGIGRAVVDLMKMRGAKVVQTYRNTPLPDGRQCDTNDPEQCRALLDSLADEGVHTVVHAAGPPVHMLHLSNVKPAEMALQLAQDASAFFNVAHSALPLLRQSQGNLVAITTAATTRYPKRDGLSSVPKAAVEEMVRALAVEEGRYGVRVNCVGPGMLTDGMAKRLMDSGELDGLALDVTRKNIPLSRFGSAYDIAEAVCFLASDAAGFISGQKLDVDGGYGV